MSYTEGVVFAFAACRERREAAVLLDGVQPVAPPGEYLVRVGLVTDVPHQQVPGSLVDVVQRDGELDSSEPGGEVTATGADRLDEELAQLARQLGELAEREAAQVGRRRDLIEERVLVWRITHQLSVYTGSGAGAWIGRASPAQRTAPQLTRATTKLASCVNAAARLPSGARAAMASSRSWRARTRALSSPTVLG